MNMVKATRRFEEWLRRRTAIVEPDLRTKHKHMAEAAFPFLRATFYRWMQVWPGVCSDLAKAPKVLAVGDLHIENFGTWRDAEGRLIWGVNDFDEAAELPYTNDLLRLATSAILAADEGHLALKPKDACEAILDGYGKSLAEHGGAFVLAEQNKWLRQIATCELRDPVPFWKKMDGLPEVKSDIPASAREALEHLLAEQTLNYRVVRRVAGLRSLGHVRLVALTECHGGKIAREARPWWRLLFIGQMNARGRRKFCIRRSSAMQYERPILLCSYGDDGLCGGSRRTAPELSSISCQRVGMNAACCSLWDGKRRTSISAPAVR